MFKKFSKPNFLWPYRCSALTETWQKNQGLWPDTSAVTGALLWDMQGPVQGGKFQELTASFSGSLNNEGMVGISFIVLF